MVAERQLCQYLAGKHAEHFEIISPILLTFDLILNHQSLILLKVGLSHLQVNTLNGGYPRGKKLKFSFLFFPFHRWMNIPVALVYHPWCHVAEAECWFCLL